MHAYTYGARLDGRVKRGMIASKRRSESRTTATVTEILGKKLGACGCSSSILSRIAAMAEPSWVVPSDHWTRGRLPSSPGVAL